MANLPIEEIEKKVGSRYALTVLAGKRARELRDGAPRLVNTDSNNPILIALQEIYEGKIFAENLDYSAPHPTEAAATEVTPELGLALPEVIDLSVADLDLPEAEEEAEVAEIPDGILTGPESDLEDESAAVPGDGYIGGEVGEPLDIEGGEEAAEALAEESPEVDAEDIALAEGAAEPQIADPVGDSDLGSIQG